MLLESHPKYMQLLRPATSVCWVLEWRPTLRAPVGIQFSDKAVAVLALIVSLPRLNPLWFIKFSLKSATFLLFSALLWFDLHFVYSDSDLIWFGKSPEEAQQSFDWDARILSLNLKGVFLKRSCADLVGKFTWYFREHSLRTFPFSFKTTRMSARKR